jgi:FkbM family methyltransferase
MALGTKQRVAGWLEQHGIVVYPTWRQPTFDLEHHIKEFFEKYQVDTVFDVGANDGQYADLLRRYIGYEGLIVSFEPIPELAAKLEQRAKQDPKWVVYRMALGDEDGRLPLTVSASSVFSSFLDADSEQGVDDFDRAMTPQRRVEVEVRRLDGLLPEIARQHQMRNIYLKVDTQGFDQRVIAGAGAAMERFCGVQSEMSLLPIYKGQPDAWTSLDTFRSKGFEITGLFPVSRDRHLRLIEFDCVMVRGSLIEQRRPA